MTTSTLTSKGQITIPKAVRDRMGLQAGDVLDFRLNDEGKLEVALRSSSVLDRVSGILKEYAQDPPPTVEEMNAAIRRRAAEKYGRTRS